MPIGTTVYDRPLTKYEQWVEYDICPECGGRKQASSVRCVACSNRRAAAARMAKDLVEMPDRDKRIRRALEQGYELAELMALAREGKLPTWEQLGMVQETGA